MRFWYCVLYIAGIGLLSQLIGTALPRRWFRANYFPYRAYSLERDGRIYDALHVYRWKDHMPDMSRISRRMVRKSIALSFTCSNAERLVAETSVWQRWCTGF